MGESFARVPAGKLAQSHRGFLLLKKLRLFLKLPPKISAPPKIQGKQRLLAVVHQIGGEERQIVAWQQVQDKYRETFGTALGTDVRSFVCALFFVFLLIFIYNYGHKFLVGIFYEKKIAKKCQK